MYIYIELFRRAAFFLSGMRFSRLIYNLLIFSLSLFVLGFFMLIEISLCTNFIESTKRRNYN